MRHVWLPVTLLALGCSGAVDPAPVARPDIAVDDAGAPYCLHVTFVPAACNECVASSCEAESVACSNDDRCTGEFECEDDCNLDAGCIFTCRESLRNDAELSLHDCAVINCSACTGAGVTYAVVPCGD
jgi:hypothetical protein